MGNECYNNSVTLARFLNVHLEWAENEIGECNRPSPRALEHSYGTF